MTIGSLGFGCAVALFAGSLGATGALGTGPSATVTRMPSIGMPPAKTTCPWWPKASGILEDGDFHAAADPGPRLERFFAHARFASGWTVARGDVDFYGSGAWREPAPYDICTVDLDGTNPGTLASAPFFTTRGEAYTVTFMLSGNPDCPPRTKRLVLRAAGQSVRFLWNTPGGHDAEHGIYEWQAWAFTAASSSTTLSFASEDGAKLRGCGPVIGAISVIQK